MTRNYRWRMLHGPPVQHQALPRAPSLVLHWRVPRPRRRAHAHELLDFAFVDRRRVDIAVLDVRHGVVVDSVIDSADGCGEAPCRVRIKPSKPGVPEERMPFGFVGHDHVAHALFVEYRVHVE